MKKIILAILAGVLCISVTACGKSEAAVAGDELISAIGEVTLDSIGDIIEAEMYVATMSEEDKKQLDYTQTLSDARMEYEDLLMGESAAIVDTEIGEIGQVTLDSEEAIAHARSTYDALDSAAQEKVTRYNDLVTAEETFYWLQVEYAEVQVDEIGTVTVDSFTAIHQAEVAIQALGENAENDMKNYDIFLQAQKTYQQAKISAVEEQISAIGVVTIESETSITLARKAYNALAPEEKSSVSNSERLDEAEEALGQAQEDALLSAMERFRIEKDEFEDTIRVYSCQQPQYMNTRCYLFPVMLLSDDDVGMAILANYTGRDYLFFDEISILIDDAKYEWQIDNMDNNSDYAYPNFCENSVFWADDMKIEALRKLAISEEATVRFSGNGHHDFTVSQSDKNAIAEMLELYDLASDVY